jgi:hypothetical protein
LPDSYPRLERALSEHVKGELVFSVNVDESVGVVSLGEDTDALYSVTGPPLTVTRELLHLRDAVVRESFRLDDSGKVELSAELASGRVLTVRPSTPRDLHERIRAALETRAADTGAQ